MGSNPLLSSWTVSSHFTIIRFTIVFLTGIVVHHYHPEIIISSNIIASYLGGYIILLTISRKYFCSILYGLYAFMGVLGIGILLACSDDSKVSFENYQYTKTYYLISLEKKEITHAYNSFVGLLYATKKDQHTWVKLEEPIKMRVTVADGDIFNTLSVDYGDNLIINGRINKITGKFKSDAYANGIALNSNVYKDNISHVGNTPLSWLMKRIINLREDLEERLLRHISSDDDTSGVIKSLLLADRSDLSRHMRHAYADAGVFHVMTPSGLHMAILLSIFLFILSSLGRCQSLALLGRYKHPIAMFFLFIYAALTNFSSPALRAALLVLLCLLCKKLTNNFSVITNLFLSALILTIIDSKTLFSVSFQFSYMATLGIMLFYKPISKILITNLSTPNPLKIKHKILNFILSVLTVSVAVHITIIPLTSFYFNTIYRPQAFIVNILLVPFVMPSILWLSIITICVSGVRIIHIACSRVLEYLVYMTDKIVVFFAHLPLGEWKYTLSLRAIIVYYAVLLY